MTLQKNREQALLTIIFDFRKAASITLGEPEPETPRALSLSELPDYNPDHYTGVFEPETQPQEG